MNYHVVDKLKKEATKSFFLFKNACIVVQDIFYRNLEKLKFNNAIYIMIKNERNSSVKIWLLGKRLVRYETKSPNAKKYLCAKFKGDNEFDITGLLNNFLGGNHRIMEFEMIEQDGVHEEYFIVKQKKYDTL